MKLRGELSILRFEIEELKNSRPETLSEAKKKEIVKLDASFG